MLLSCPPALKLQRYAILLHRLFRPQIVNVKVQLVALVYMALWLLAMSVIALVKRDVYLRGREFGRAHNGHALRHHDLISSMRVQVSRAHEARLCRVRVDPSQ